MSSVAIPTFRALLRGVKLYAQSSIPLVGIKGFPFPPVCASATETVKHHFRTANNLDNAFLALRLLFLQLDVLKGADDWSREVLSSWKSGLWSAQQQQSAAKATEDVMLLLFSIWQQQQQHNSHLEIEGEEQQEQQDNASFSSTMDQLAAQARQEHQSKLSCSSGGDSTQQEGSASPSGRVYMEDQLACISKVLFHDLRFKSHPLEWVYDGLSPILLPHVLNTRKGVPMALAVLYCGVARRLGIEATPLRAEGRATGLAGWQVPPEVAARHAGRTLASAPPPSDWLVAVQTSQEEPVMFVDIGDKGKVLSEQECLLKYPAAPKALPSQHQVPLLAAAELARTMLTAYQRRGESDLAAQWLYQLLALDPTAPEWDHFLAAAGSRTRR